MQISRKKNAPGEVCSLLADDWHEFVKGSKKKRKASFRLKLPPLGKLLHASNYQASGGNASTYKHIWAPQ